MHPVELQAHVRRLVEPTIERLGFDLVAVEWVSNVLRLSLDGAKGVSVGDIAHVSRAVAPVLDADDPIAGKYTLEVSSPGIERPVQRVDDFRRFQGYRIKIRLLEGYPRRRYTGVLGAVVDHDVLLLQDGQEHTISLDSIERAHLVLELEEFLRLGEGLPPIPDSGQDSDPQETSS